MILVTGGTGLLGSHVLYELIKKHFPVRAIYHHRDKIAQTRSIFRFYENDDSAFNLIEWAEADINDGHSLSVAFQGIKKVYHTAGYVTFNDREKKKLFHINSEGTRNVVNTCLNQSVDKLCHVSSIAALGDMPEGIPVTEENLWNQGTSASAYAISKYKAEMEVWRGIHEGMNAVIVNPSVLIGPGMWLGPGQHLWNSVKQGLRFYPAGSTGYVDVRDAASVMFMLCESEISGERYILNSGHMSHFEFLSLLAGNLNSRIPSVPVTPLLSKAALWGESVRALISGTSPRFSSRTLKTASQKLLYSGEKVRNKLDFNFIPIEESIVSAVQIYRRHS